mgnify:CR=1 FL=1
MQEVVVVVATRRHPAHPLRPRNPEVTVVALRLMVPAVAMARLLLLLQVVMEVDQGTVLRLPQLALRRRMEARLLRLLAAVSLLEMATGSVPSAATSTLQGVVTAIDARLLDPMHPLLLLLLLHHCPVSPPRVLLYPV